jgi:1,4-dihydroxy-2-naphthoate octaprenyltransferase
MDMDSSRPIGRPINPVLAEFSGDSPARIAKRLFHATRPKFFPASVLPVLAGTAWGAAATGQIGVGVFLLALLATVCVHAGSNVLNDVGDDAGGTDRQNDRRIYPYTGGSRFIQEGILDAKMMARLGWGLLAVATLAGVCLFAIKGILIVYFGLAGVLLGVLYSLGPVRLSALGLGESAVAVAFGILPVSGSAWLQGAAIDLPLLLFAIPVSAWVAAILLINEVPDIGADGATGKRTLPVRLGLVGTSWLYFAIHLVAALSIVVLATQRGLPMLAPVVPVLLLLLAWRASATIRDATQDRTNMTKAIESTLAIHTLGCLWLTGCALFYVF